MVIRLEETDDGQVANLCTLQSGYLVNKEAMQILFFTYFLWHIPQLWGAFAIRNGWGSLPTTGQCRLVQSLVEEKDGNGKGLYLPGRIRSAFIFVEIPNHALSSLLVERKVLIPAIVTNNTNADYLSKNFKYNDGKIY